MRSWGKVAGWCGVLGLVPFLACAEKVGGKGDSPGDGDFWGGGDGDTVSGTGAMGSEGTGAAGSGAANGTGSTTGSGGAPYVPMDCPAAAEPALTVTRLDTTAISDLGTPFDTDGDDLEGPGDWQTRYGKSPEIVPYSSGETLDVLFQDQSSSERAFVVNIVPVDDSYEVAAAFEVESQGRIMGLTKDSSGNYYVATGVDEGDVVDEVYPPNEIHRPDIVRIVKFDIHGCVLMESDVDMERGKADSGSEIIVNPMTAASSRLVWGGDRLLLVHGHNTEPDFDIGGQRHQKAISTLVDALTGAVTRTSTMWVSHSFDQRALYDGSGFVELHLGDAYPRYVALGRYNDDGGEGSYAVYQIKGNTGANETHTRLGSIVQSPDPTYGYMAIFTTDRSPTPGDDLQGTYDVALVRIQSNFYQADTDESVIEDSGVDTHVVESAGETVTNHLRWLTDLGAGSHANRPRLVGIGGDQFIALYERWNNGGDDFDGTYAMIVNAAGDVVTGPTEVPGDHHIGRGDDIVAVGGRAVFVTGGGGAIHLNFVGADLSGERVSLP